MSFKTVLLNEEEYGIIIKLREDKNARYKKYEPKMAHEYNDLEKIAIFKSLHKLALEEFERLIIGNANVIGNTNVNSKYCIYRAVMELLSRSEKSVFDMIK